MGGGLVATPLYCFQIFQKSFMEIYFLESTSLYIYSSFLQANAAIIAVLGLFIIYKIQALQSSIDIIKSDLMRDRGMYSHPKTVLCFDSATIEEKEKIFNEMKKDHYYLLHYKIWIDSLKNIANLKSLIKTPTIFLTLVIISDGISLLLCSNLHKYHRTAEIYLAYIIILIHIILWLYICKAIINVIKQN